MTNSPHSRYAGWFLLVGIVVTYGLMFLMTANGAPCYFNASAGAGSYVNFFNTNDFALGKWQIDQNLKPDAGYSWTYEGPWSTTIIPFHRRQLFLSSRLGKFFHLFGLVIAPVRWNGVFGALAPKTQWNRTGGAGFMVGWWPLLFAPGHFRR